MIKFIEDFNVGMQSTMEKIVTLEDIKNLQMLVEILPSSFR